jgi:hypothetical protein
VPLAFNFNASNWSVVIHLQWINSIKIAFHVWHHTLNQYSYSYFHTSLMIIFLTPWYSYHCTQFLNFVNIDTPHMHFQFSALISRPVWYVKNPILVQHCSSSLKKSKFQFQFYNRFQKSDSIPVQCLVTKTGTGNSNPPNSVQAQHWSKLQTHFQAIWSLFFIQCTSHCTATNWWT